MNKRKLINELGKVLNDRIDAIRNSLGAFEPTYVSTREGVDNVSSVYTRLSFNDI